MSYRNQFKYYQIWSICWYFSIINSSERLTACVKFTFFTAQKKGEKKGISVTIHIHKCDKSFMHASHTSVCLCVSVCHMPRAIILHSSIKKKQWQSVYVLCVWALKFDLKKLCANKYDCVHSMHCSTHAIHSIYIAKQKYLSR